MKHKPPPNHHNFSRAFCFTDFLWCYQLHRRFGGCFNLEAELLLKATSLCLPLWSFTLLWTILLRAAVKRHNKVNVIAAYLNTWSILDIIDSVAIVFCSAVLLCWNTSKASSDECSVLLYFCCHARINLQGQIRDTNQCQMDVQNS